MFREWSSTSSLLLHYASFYIRQKSNVVNVIIVVFAIGAEGTEGEDELSERERGIVICFCNYYWRLVGWEGSSGSAVGSGESENLGASRLN